MATFNGGKNRNDTFVGTGADDLFRFDPADLTSGDFIVGGGGKGRDVLELTAGGALAADALANVIGIEEIRLSQRGNTVVLLQSLVDTASGGNLVVKGGKGADRINAANVIDEGEDGASLQLLGGAGNDIIIGGHSSQTFIDGGKGADTIVIDRGSAVYDAKDISITARGDDARLMITTGITLDLTRAGDLTEGDRCDVRGFIHVDASRSSQAVALTGTGESELTGGSGDDTIVGGFMVSGGKGRDTLLGQENAAGTQIFLIGEGDFVAGETIIGRNRYDYLEVVGSADLRTGRIEGIDQLLVFAGKGSETLVSAYTSQVSQINVQPRDDVWPTVDLYLDTKGPYTDVGTYSYTVNLRATSKADQINVQIMNVYAGGGDDVVAGSGSIYAGAGDDVVTFRNSPAAPVVLDGGQGRDLLSLWSVAPGVIDLSAKDQLLSGTPVMRGFEDLDLAGGTPWTVTGSKVANRIAGGSAADTISGGGGNDVLEGRGGADHLTGGAGRDTFRWSERDETLDIVSDFAAEDRLSFAANAFAVSGGAMDVRMVATARPADVHGVDLLIYTGGALNAFVDVFDALPAEQGRDATGGIFVAGRSSAGETMLFHAAFNGTAMQVDAIANLGSLIAPDLLDLGAFILA